MAFPQVAATNTSSEDSDVQNHTVSLPASIQAGETLLVFFSCQTNQPIGWPGGWNEIFENQQTDVTLAIAWRKADGGEGATITVTTNDVEISAHASYRINVAIDPTSTPPEVSTGATGTSENPNPDSLTADGGSKEYLWIAVEGNDEDKTVTAYPTNYDSNQLNIAVGGKNGAGIGVASDEVETDVQDPATFTLSGSKTWIACTVVVYPGGITHLGAATLSGIGTLVAVGSFWWYGVATLTGVGTLAGIGRGIFVGAATLSGTGTLSAIGRRIFTGVATLTGQGTLVASAVSTLIGQVTLSGAGTLSAIGGFWKYGVATLSGVGTLVSSGVITAIGQVTLAGVGTLSAIGRGIFTGKATLAGVGSLSAIGSFFRYGVAALTGQGALVANGVITTIGKATLSGAGTLAVIGGLWKYGKVTLSGIGTLTAILTKGKAYRKLKTFMGRNLSDTTNRDLSPFRGERFEE